MTGQVIPLPQRRVRTDDAVLAGLSGLAEGVEVRLHPSMPHYVQRLMATLAARVIFDPAVAPGEAWTEMRGHP